MAPRTPDDTEIDTTVTDSGAEAVLRTGFSVIGEDARTLMEAATLLSDADTPEKVSVALDHNLKLWVAIRTVLQDAGNTLPGAAKENLRTLSKHVGDTTMEITKGPFEASKLIALAKINMHIAEGLLEGQRKKLVEERAYAIWEEEGRPHGRDLEHWARAEQDIAAETAD